MSSLETHRRKADEFRDGASRVKESGLLVEAWFLSAYHLIGACAAKKRVHIQKHQRVPDEFSGTRRSWVHTPPPWPTRSAIWTTTPEPSSSTETPGRGPISQRPARVSRPSSPSVGRCWDESSPV